MSNFIYDVFISYSHNDADWVKNWLLPGLESAGLKVCIDFRDFEIGAPSIVNMENAVQRSGKTLLVLTPAWLQSEWTSFESLLIQTKDPVGTRRRLLPLMLEKCTLPDRLGIFTYSDFTDPANWNLEMVRLINSIRPPLKLPNDPNIQPNLVHPYPLQANFTGRLREREELTAWLTDNEKPIYELIAMGGMGKSALTWYWLTHDVLPSSETKLDGVMWWSFYEGESSFAKFIDDALTYVSGHAIDASQLPTTYDRAQELRRRLQNKRVLFILDGFERQLRDYASLDAAYRADKASDFSRESRSCVDPNAARLLSDIGSVTTAAKVLITTRLSVSDLQDRAAAAIAGVIEKELKELQSDDAVVFMQAQGVSKGTFAEIMKECAAYGYHPLSLRLLSGLIKHDARTPGDIAAAPRHDVHSDLVQRRHHVLERSYNALPKRERALLSRIAAFRGAMIYEALAIFNTLGGERRFNEALDDLRVRGLVQRDLEHNRYDLHPIVRHYAYHRLADKNAVHTHLQDYFAKLPVPEQDKVRTIEDIAPIIERYYHTICAGQYDDAWQLFYARINVLLLYRFAANQIRIELLRALFPGGEDLPDLKDETMRAWTLNALSTSYGMVGEPRRAARIHKLAIAMVEKLGEDQNLVAGLSNLAYEQCITGELTSAKDNLLRALELSRKMGDEFLVALQREELGRVLAILGDFEGANAELKVSQAVIDTRNTNFSTVVRSSVAQRALLMGDARGALAAAREAIQRAYTYYPTVGIVERDIIGAEWLMGAALLLEGNDLSGAFTYLDDALNRCRRIGLIEYEPDILLGLARWYQARSILQQAKTSAEEALAISDRCDFRLKQSEIHNFLADLAKNAGNHGSAKEHAQIAKERAWCDGPPYSYKPALDEAEAMLKSLNVHD